MKNAKALIIVLSIIAGLLVIGGSWYAYVNKSKVSDNGKLIGGDKDEYGCLLAAGYSWCEAEQKCQRSWEEACPTEEIVKKYLGDNLSELSPEKEVLGGKFFLTGYEATGPTSATIEYEDGHIFFRANISFSIAGEIVNINNFTIIQDDGPTTGKASQTAIELTRLLAEKQNKNPEEVTIIIEKQTESFANGTVEFLPNDQPGNTGKFLAARVDEAWTIVADGNGLPSCSVTDPYGFPSDILPDCVNEQGVLRNNDWDAIANAISNCEVKEVFQAHSLYVYAILKNKDKLEGVEPKIDDIIDLAVSSEDKCGKIIMATE